MTQPELMLSAERADTLREFIDSFGWHSKFYLEYNPIRHEHEGTIYIIWGNTKDVNSFYCDRARIDFPLPAAFITIEDTDSEEWRTLLINLAYTLEHERWECISIFSRHELLWD